MMTLSRSLAALTAVALLGMATAAQADPIQFAGFTQKVGGNPVTFTNSNGNITSVSYDATFQYTNIGGLPPALAGPIDATVTITLTGAGTGLSTFIAPGLTLLSNSYTTGVITITNNDAIGPHAVGSNLLKLTATDGTVSGFKNASSATYSGDDTQAKVVYTSAFIVIPTTYEGAYSITFGSLASKLAQMGAQNQFIDNTASGNGSFYADPPPSIPEPASIVLMGLGLVGTPLVLRRRKTAVVNS